MTTVQPNLPEPLAVRVTPAALPKPVSRDPDDDHVLACAPAAQAGLIVSGDDDLLALGACRGIPIRSPAQAIDYISVRG